MSHKISGLYCLSILFTIVLMGYSPAQGLTFSWASIGLSSLLIFTTSMLFIGLWTGFLSVLRLPNKIKKYLESAPIALFGTSIIWIHADSFLYTAFGKNSLSADLAPNKVTLFKVIYGIIFLVLAISLEKIREKRTMFYFSWSAATLVGVLAIAHFFNLRQLPKVESPNERPHIIILSFDSLEASLANEALSFPFLNKHKSEFFTADNFYSNACCTHGAIAALYSGTTPLVNKVAYPPAKIEGNLTTLNFPMLLKTIGYTNHSLTTSLWANAKELGILSSFDYVLGFRKGVFESALALEYFGDVEQVLKPMQNIQVEISNRIDRYFFGSSSNFNVYDEVTDAVSKNENDEEKMKYLLRTISEMKSPQFIHAHFMALHAIYRDDISIVDIARKFDGHISNIYEALEKSGNLDKTILIITSDHGLRWDSAVKLPLWIRFPREEHKGEFEPIVQTADIAPTLANFLKLKHNVRFDGLDIFSNTTEINRTIFSVSGILHGEKLEAPHFLMEGVFAIGKDGVGLIPWEKFKTAKDGTIEVDVKDAVKQSRNEKTVLPHL